MSDEEKEVINKVNIDKARNKTLAPILLMVLSLLTYVFHFLSGDFDFGVIFESVSLLFLLISRSYMSKYDGNRAKRYIICSIVAIGWILIYDIIIFISSIQYVIGLAVSGYYYFFGEIASVVYLIILFKINKDLSKADNPIKYKESTDWFYERYEDGGKK